MKLKFSRKRENIDERIYISLSQLNFYDPKVKVIILKTYYVGTIQFNDSINVGKRILDEIEDSLTWIEHEIEAKTKAGIKLFSIM